MGGPRRQILPGFPYDSVKDVDAVHIATPDRWHAIASFLVSQAGNDVYVEAGIADNLRRSRDGGCVACKSKRIVQGETRPTSFGALFCVKIPEMIQRGDIGEVKFVAFGVREPHAKRNRPAAERTSAVVVGLGYVSRNFTQNPVQP